jgi:hypothetical protein
MLAPISVGSIFLWFVFGFFVGLGWHLAGWLLGKVLK